MLDFDTMFVKSPTKVPFDSFALADLRVRNREQLKDHIGKEVLVVNPVYTHCDHPVQVDYHFCADEYPHRGGLEILTVKDVTDKSFNELHGYSADNGSERLQTPSGVVLFIDKYTSYRMLADYGIEPSAHDGFMSPNNFIVPVSQVKKVKFIVVGVDDEVLFDGSAGHLIEEVHDALCELDTVEREYGSQACSCARRAKESSQG